MVVDTQKLITNEKLYNFPEFVSKVEKLIDTARKNRIEVIYVRHDDGPESELTKGTDGFEIYEKFKPSEEEKLFDKHVNSAFKEMGLLEYLIRKEEKEIIIVGLQTDYCIDATIKCGFEHGFNIIVQLMQIQQKTINFYRQSNLINTTMNLCGMEGMQNACH